MEITAFVSFFDTRSEAKITLEYTIVVSLIRIPESFVFTVYFSKNQKISM